MRRFVITARKDTKLEFLECDKWQTVGGRREEPTVDRGTFANIEELINYLDEKHPGLLPHRKGNHG